MILAGDFSGLGFDQIIAARDFAGAIQWLGDTDRDTTQEYLFRFGLDDMTPLVADMNGDGYDDVIAVDTTTTSNLLQWYIHYWDPTGATDYTSDQTVPVHAQFRFGVDGDNAQAGGGLADIPVVGDFTGDGRADVVAVRRNGLFFDWYVSFAETSGNAYPNDAGQTILQDTFYAGYGSVSGIPLTGDWDNDGDDNMAVVVEGDGAGGTSRWYIDTDNSGGFNFNVDYGLTGDQYYVGNWADTQWNGSTDLSWNTAANWSAGTIPAAGEQVVIDQPGASLTVTAPSSVSVGSLRSAESITAAGGLFSLTQASTVRGEGISLTSGAGLSLGGLFTGDVQLNDAGSVLSLSGNDLIDGTLTVAAGGFIVAGRRLSNPVEIAGDFSNIGLGNLTLAGPVTLTADTVITTPFAQSGVTLATVSGPFGVTKVGPGSLTIDGISTYTGATTISGGTLSGIGTLAGPLTIASGATASPGNSPGLWNTGDLDLAAGSVLQMEVGGAGASPGIDYDQVNVTGSVTLAGTLDTILYSNILLGQNYTIINNDGVDPVVGTFSGLAEGAVVSIGTGTFTISYAGGDGNDVVLSATSTTNFDSFWEGEGPNNRFDNPLNWRSGVVPGLSDTVLIDTADNGVVLINAPVTVNSLQIQNPVTLGGNVTTTLSQSYNGPAALSNNVNLSGAGVTFGSTVDGPFRLVVASNSGQQSLFVGEIGGTTPLSSLAVFGQVEFRGGGGDNNRSPGLSQRCVCGCRGRRDNLHQHRFRYDLVRSGDQRIPPQRHKRGGRGRCEYGRLHGV